MAGKFFLLFHLNLIVQFKFESTEEKNIIEFWIAQICATGWSIWVLLGFSKSKLNVILFIPTFKTICPSPIWSVSKQKIVQQFTQVVCGSRESHRHQHADLYLQLLFVENAHKIITLSMVQFNYFIVEILILLTNAYLLLMLVVQLLSYCFVCLFKVYSSHFYSFYACASESASHLLI